MSDDNQSKELEPDIDFNLQDFLEVLKFDITSSSTSSTTILDSHFNQDSDIS